MSIATGAWAVDTTAPAIPEDYKDITPGYFKFFQQEDDSYLDAMIKDDHKYIGGGGAHLNNTNNITNNLDEKGDKYFTSEGINNGYLLFGGWIYNQTKQDVFKKAFSHVNLGGEVGNVLVLNGENSKLSEKIGDIFNAEAPELGNTNINGNLQLFWILDHLTSNQITNADNGINLTKAKIRIELNLYHNSMMNATAISSILRQYEDAASFGTVKAINFNEFADNDGNWDPCKWMVYEVDVPNTSQVASFIKMSCTTSPANLNDGAILIRSIEVYGIPEGSSSENTNTLNTPVIYYNNYSSVGSTGGDTSGVGNIDTDENVPVEYYNLQGVKVANPEKGVFIKKQGNKSSKVVL